MSRIQTGMVLLLMFAAGTVMGQVGAQTKSKAPKSASASARSIAAIQQDLTKAQMELAGVIKSPSDLMDREKRMEIAGQAVPVLRRMVTLYSEMAAADPENAEQYKSIRKKLEPSLAILHDDATLEDLKKMSESKTVDDAVYAKATLLLVQYVDVPQSPIDQNPIIDDFEKLAKANPNNEDLVITYTTARLANIAAGPEQKDRWDKAFGHLKSPMARDVQKLLEIEKSLRLK